MDENPQPLIYWVLLRFPETPKARAKQWIQAGRVRVAGTVLRKPHYLLTDPGDALELSKRDSAEFAFGPGWRIHPRVTLLFLDSSLGVINKGPGLLSVPAAGDRLSVLSIVSDFLSGRLKPSDRRLASAALPANIRKLEPLAVHRLDQYTSGVFCVAMNPAARSHLIAQVKAHTMKREYIAFVQGKPSTKAGTWRGWLQLDEEGFRQHVVPGPSPGLRPSGKPKDAARRVNPRRAAPQEAVTHYEVLTEFQLPDNRGVICKLRLRLETGRKHQIRIQAAHAGLPLVGDRTYNPMYRGAAGAAASIPFDRQALHSASLSLEHPARPGEVMTWAADLPPDLKELEAILRHTRV